MVMYPLCSPLCMSGVPHLHSLQVLSSVSAGGHSMFLADPYFNFIAVTVEPGGQRRERNERW